MGKNKKHKAKKTRKPKKNQKVYKSKWLSVYIKQIPSSVKIIVSILAFVFGFLGFVQLIYPSISVRAGSTMSDPNNPFTASFLILNLGTFPVYDFDYSLKIKNLKSNSRIADTLNISELSADFVNSNIPKIKKIATINMRRMNAPFTNVISAEIFIKWSFNSFLIPYTFNDSSRFVLSKNINNQYIWLENPYDFQD